MPKPGYKCRYCGHVDHNPKHCNRCLRPNDRPMYSATIRRVRKIVVEA